MKYVVCIVNEDGHALFGNVPVNKSKAERWAKAYRLSGERCFVVRYAPLEGF